MSWPAWTLGSWVRIPLEAWMFVCVYSVLVLTCVGSGLATGWSLVQRVLPILCVCKITEPHKEEAKARYGLQHHIRRRRRVCSALRWAVTTTVALINCFRCNYDSETLALIHDGWRRKTIKMVKVICHLRGVCQLQRLYSVKWNGTTFINGKFNMERRKVIFFNRSLYL
jgi:hypothetical protein